MAGVALHARARIETACATGIGTCLGSPSTRGRGLKPSQPRFIGDLIRSPSTRGRGLKHGKLITALNGVGRPPREGAD